MLSNPSQLRTQPLQGHNHHQQLAQELKPVAGHVSPDRVIFCMQETPFLLLKQQSQYNRLQYIFGILVTLLTHQLLY